MAIIFGNAYKISELASQVGDDSSGVKGAQYEINRGLMSSTDGYIHYYASNDDSINLGQIQQTKDDILMNYLGRIASRNLQDEASLSGVLDNYQDIEQILQGTIFDNLDPQINENGERTKFSDMSLSDAEASLNVAEEAFNDATNFITSCENEVMDYFNTDDPTILADYATALLDMYASTHQVVGQLGPQIVNSLVAENDDKFFSTFGEANKLPGHITKLIGIIASLPSPSQLSPSDAQSEIMRTLEEKYGGWLSDFDNSADKASQSLVMLKGRRELYDRMKDIGFDDIHYVGKNKVNVDVVQAEKAVDVDGASDSPEELAAHLTSVLETAQKTRKTGVSTYELTGDGISATFGVRELKGRRDLKPTSKSWTTRVRHSQSLMNILVNELHFSAEELMAVYNIAAGHDGGDKGAASGLEAEWQSLIQYAKYETFLSAIGNMVDGIPQWANFVSINGNLWTTADFVTAVMGSDANKISMVTTSRGDSGLERSTYVDLNVWRSSGHNYKKNADTYQALIRSAYVRPLIRNRMNAAKVDINLSIKEVAALMNLRR